MLVIIGLIVGGVLVGQSLIGAAAVRAQISQIENFQTAKNTFYGKFGYLPGDIPAGPAAQFGFAARGSCAGEGDGNGVIQGIWQNCSGAGGTNFGAGENMMFWVDLSTAGLIEGGFSSASSTNLTSVSSTALPQYLPVAKLGSGNYVYVYSGWWWTGTWATDSINYFGLAQVTSIGGTYYLLNSATPGLTVQQAFSIDKKVDDGSPQSGNILASSAAGSSEILWAGTSNEANVSYTAATPGSATTCFDNGNLGGAPQQYSVEISNGTGVNCALSFRFH